VGFPWCKNGLAGSFGFQIVMAEKRAAWVITKKVFFDPLKNTDFLQFLKMAG
jgi:hypothetical protein